MKRVAAGVVWLAAPWSAAAAAECNPADVVLQLLHVQDVSFSSDDVRDALLPSIPAAVGDLTAAYHAVWLGVASFSDKPIRPHGDPRGDYCYREDAALSETLDLAAAVGDLPILSGLDWRESQYDAVWAAAASSTLGWIEPTPEGRHVQRVAVLVTDSVPHEAGTLPQQPGGPLCEANDYPAAADLEAQLETENLKLVVVCSGDVVGLWESRVGGWANAVVLHDVDYYPGLVGAVASLLALDDCPTNAPPTTEAPLPQCAAPTVTDTNITCTEHCRGKGMVCLPLEQNTMDTTEESCTAAVTYVFGGIVDVGPLDHVSDAQLAGGCGGSYDFVTTIYPQLNSLGEAGCDNSAGTGELEHYRLCCCGEV